jgi:hypothetical protein
MKNLKSFKLYEGDWWDNDPSAPWNQDDREAEPVADIEYSESQRAFVVLGTPGDDAILKKKSDGSLWLMDVTDVAHEYVDYMYFYPGGEDDDRERAEGNEEEEYASIATDLFKENNFLEGKEAWENRDAERLFKIDQDLAEYLIDEYVNYSRQRDRRHAPSTSNMEEYKMAASILSKAFPEA